MSFVDPDALDGVAANISRHAEEMRSRATRLVAAAAAARWHSLAANGFRAEVEGLARSYRVAADGVDDAAAALRRHADLVRDVQRALKIAETLTNPVQTVRAVVHLFGG